MLSIFFMISKNILGGQGKRTDVQNFVRSTFAIFCGTSYRIKIHVHLMLAMILLLQSLWQLSQCKHVILYLNFDVGGWKKTSLFDDSNLIPTIAFPAVIALYNAALFY